MDNKRDNRKGGRAPRLLALDVVDRLNIGYLLGKELARGLRSDEEPSTLASWKKLRDFLQAIETHETYGVVIFDGE